MRRIEQLQLDIFGEVMDALHVAAARRPRSRRRRVAPAAAARRTRWRRSGREPDEGFWEVRGPRRHFTHSKVMAWVALDRAVKNIERFGLYGPADRWRAGAGHDPRRCLRARPMIPRATRSCSPMAAHDLDASLLMMAARRLSPRQGPAHPTARSRRSSASWSATASWRGIRRRPASTACRPERAPSSPVASGSPTTYALLGRDEDARRCFDRLLGLCNDVGLLSEEYDPERASVCVGNFPQAFSHVSLINTAFNLSRSPGPADIRPKS